MRSSPPAAVGRRDVGEQVRVGEQGAAEICDGVVATHAFHPDGEEVLLDLAGPRQLVLGHPIDGCHIRHVAVTEVAVRRLTWPEVAGSAELVARLRDQLRWREAWAAAQAHTRTEDKLAGILALLSERFGVEGVHGVVIDVPLTHAQLAAATGRTRSTVTRALQQMVAAQAIDVVGRGARQRYLLPSSGAARATRH